MYAAHGGTRPLDLAHIRHALASLFQSVINVQVLVELHIFHFTVSCMLQTYLQAAASYLHQ